MKLNKAILLILILVLMVLWMPEAEAQCAMCRASVENNISNGDAGIGSNLNKGILYLLALPYLLGMTLIYLWFKHSRKAKKKLSF